MSIIIYSAAAQQNVDVDRLVNEYDRAKDDDQRQQIATQIFNLASPQIAAKIRSTVPGRLNPDQVHSLTWQALMKGLNESGMPRFKRLDGSNWDGFVQKIKQQQTPAARHVWQSLDADTRKQLEAPYLKSTAVDALLKELNAMLRDPKFYDPQTWGGVTLNDETRATQQQSIGSTRGLVRFNAGALASAFPELKFPEQPPQSLMGYITTGVLQRMKPSIWEEATGRKPNEYLTEVYNGVKQDLAAVDRMNAEGKLPAEWEGLSKAEQVYRSHKQRLSTRYGPVIAWWNDKLKKILGPDAFNVSYNEALQRARPILAAHPDIAPPDQWQKRGSPYFLPLTAVAPYGVKSIQRMLNDQQRFRSTSLDEAKGWNAQPAAAPQSPSSQQLENAQPVSDPSTYMSIVNQVYGRPGYEVEKAVATFLGGNQNPSSEQVQQFLATQPPDISETVHDVGWRNIVSEIDSKIMSHMQEQPVPLWSPRPTGSSPGQRQPVAPVQQSEAELETVPKNSVPRIAAIFRRVNGVTIISRLAMLQSA